MHFVWALLFCVSAMSTTPPPPAPATMPAGSTTKKKRHVVPLPNHVIPGQSKRPAVGDAVMVAFPHGHGGPGGPGGPGGGPGGGRGGKQSN